MMKRIAFLAFIVFAIASCDKAINKYKCYEPIYTDEATFRTPATFESPRSINKDGAIYFKDDYLFVVEPNQGIHFINNSNPSAPVNTGFLKVMGASGLAIRGDYLYITALVDLVIVDVSTISNPVEIAREEELFPTALPIMDKNYPTKTIDKSQGIVTSWKVIEVEEEDNLNQTPQWTGCLGCEMLTVNSMDAGGGSSATGTAGSFARITIVNDYLYVLDEWKLKSYNISNPTNLVAGQEVSVWWEAETIFPTDDHLYLGTTTGMMIYGLDDPSMPQHLGSISHARACDPVVVQDNYAYVTVRSGGPCGGDINQLDVVDISDKNNPILVHTVQLDNPHGVGVDGNTLFVCDGDSGLRVFDISNKTEVDQNQLKRFGNIQATDVIPLNGVAMVIGDDGLYQYDYSDPTNLDLLSTIKF